MPHLPNIGKVVERRCICKVYWDAGVSITISDVLQLDKELGLDITISWRPKNKEKASSLPKEEQVVELSFRRIGRGGGDIRFEGKDGPSTLKLTGDLPRTRLKVYGQALSSDKVDADVFLDVKIDKIGEKDEPIKSIPLAVRKTLPFQVEIRAENGKDPAPTSIPPNQPVRLKAVTVPETPGTFRWVSAGAGLTVKSGADTDTVEIVGHPGSTDERKLSVHFQAQKGPFVMAEHVMAFLGEKAGVTTSPRESIAFIMGDDFDFYRPARGFYTINKPTRLVEDLRTLGAVRDYLELKENQPSNGLPWGEINIVAHATEEGGMEIHITPPPEGANPDVYLVRVETLREVLEKQKKKKKTEQDWFKPLPVRLIDEQTTIWIRGCALGRAPEMLKLLSQAFGEMRPVVRAPRNLQGYGVKPELWMAGLGKAPDVAYEFYLEFWVIDFNPQKSPTIEQKAGLFKNAYPGVAEKSDPKIAEQVAKQQSQPKAAKQPDPVLEWWIAALKKEGPPPGNEARFALRERPYRFTDSYSPVPKDQGQLTQTVNARPGFTTAQAIVENERIKLDDGRIKIIFDYESGGTKQSDGYIIVGLPTTQKEREEWLKGMDSVQKDMKRLERTIQDYQWEVTPSSKSWKLTDQVTVLGKRPVIRVQRRLRKDGVDFLPDINDDKHFGVFPEKKP
jgi:hypothetical protein